MSNSIVRFGLKGTYFKFFFSCYFNSNLHVPDNTKTSPQKLENFKVQIQKLEHSANENSKNNDQNENAPESNCSIVK